jgi:hypothetical protein
MTASDQAASDHAERVVSTAQATGIQARYTYNQKQLIKALESGDNGKIELLQGKIAAIVSEAEQKGVNLVDVDEDAAPAPKPKPTPAASKAVSASAPAVSGKAKVQAKLAATAKGSNSSNSNSSNSNSSNSNSSKSSTKAAAADPEAAAAMTALDKGKDKAAGKKEPPKPRRTHDCLCGCGQETLSLFAPGHDARVKGILLKVERGELTRDAIPETVAPFVKFKGKHGTKDFVMTACPVKIPGRSNPEAEGYVAHTGIDALEALDV